MAVAEIPRDVVHLLSNRDCPQKRARTVRNDKYQQLVANGAFFIAHLRTQTYGSVYYTRKRDKRPAYSCPGIYNRYPRPLAFRIDTDANAHT